MDDEDFWELDELEGSGGSHAELATLLEERAATKPAGSEVRSGFLDSAGDHWELAEDHVRAEAAYRASIAEGGDPSRYAEGALVLLLLQAGRDAEADGLLDRLLRAARADQLVQDTYEIVGGSLEEAGRHRQALRWYTMPLRQLDPDLLERGHLILLHGRHRVRAALGLPEDRFDAERARLVAEHSP